MEHGPVKFGANLTIVNKFIKDQDCLFQVKLLHPKT